MTERTQGERFQATVAQKVIKYSKVRVRVFGSRGEAKVVEGRGKEPTNVPLGTEDSDAPEDSGGADRPRYPIDRTDVWSSYQAVKRAFAYLVGTQTKAAEHRTTYDNV